MAGILDDKEGETTDEQGIVRYVITGRAAHERIVPLLPSGWVDCTTKSTSTSTGEEPDFLWENAPHHETRSYRDSVHCYSHLPNGTAVLDDKWALARLALGGTKHALETHCFRGPDGFASFCERLHVLSDSKQVVLDNSTSTPDETQFPDLVPPILKEKESTLPAPEGPLPPPPCNLWVIKDAGSNGAGGIWMVHPGNAHLIQASLLPNHRYVAQRYAWPPVLFKGRKCHVRVYGLLTSANPDTFQEETCMYVHDQCFLHVANEPFSYPSSLDDNEDKEQLLDASVHITNCCANSHDQDKFAGEIVSDLSATTYQTSKEGVMVVPLEVFRPSIHEQMEGLARSSVPFIRGGHANGGFQYLGIDFVLSYEENAEGQLKPVAYLLEVNAPPSQDTATCLDHAEAVHNSVLGDLLNLWVLPKISGGAIPSKPGRWQCVYREYDKKKSDASPKSATAIIPSKAVILNKIKWTLFEQKMARLDNEAAARKDKQDSPEQVGEQKELVSVHNDTPTLSFQCKWRTKCISQYARMQFPYFSECHQKLNKSNYHPDDDTTAQRMLFFESAGGAQVPRTVIESMTESMAYRHRNVIGAESKRRARRTLQMILGASPDNHLLFLGSNATTLLDRLAHIYVSKKWLTRDDEIIMSTENHLANVSPWLRAAQEMGARVIWWNTRADTDMARNDRLKDLLGTNTRLVVMSHASNILGEVRDVSSICRMVKQITHGKAHMVVDGVAAVPHIFSNVQNLGVDWYVASCHKLFGPHLGALCGLKSTFDEYSPAQDIYREFELGTLNLEGCEGIHGLGIYFAGLGSFSLNEFAADREKNDATLDQRQPSNQCTESKRDRDHDSQIISTLSLHHGRTPIASPVSQATPDLSLDLVQKAYERIRQVEVIILEAFLKQLRKCSHVHILENSSDPNDQIWRLPIVSFVHDKIKSSMIVSALYSKNIICRTGRFLCTDEVLAEWGLFNVEEHKGLMRCSFAHYNTVSEVNMLCNALGSIADWW